MANLIPDSPLHTMAEVSIMMRSNALRSVSFSGENDLYQKTSAADPFASDAREAELLLSFTTIAEKEIRSMGSPARLWDDDEDLQAFPTLPNFGGAPRLPVTLASPICSLKKPLSRTWFPLMQPRLASPMVQSTTSSTEGDLSDSTYSTDDSKDHEGSWKRLRSVSIDSPVFESPGVLTSLASGTANLVTPLNTPVLVRGLKLPMRKARLRQAKKAKRERRSSNKGKKTNTTTVAPPVPAEAADDNKKRSLKAVVVPKGKVVKTILRKKFSWKNYPELEAFLIANREEYLRHSALNYTIQQKQYNNSLTERLLELAGEHGYVFDDVEFSFVTVRDRIRCYFKSYVQSAKKKGIIIGYAARKAGLLSTNELEESAHQKGKIMG